LTVPTAPPREWVRAWKPEVPGISEVFHARFVEHVYPRHTHEDWTVFIVDDGGIRYDLDRYARGVGTSLVTVLPPHVVHDGRPSTQNGFRKRVLYIGQDVLGPHLIGRAADEPDIHDQRLLGAIRRLHPLLECPDDALEAESVMAVVGEILRHHLGESPTTHRPRDRSLANALRDLLDAQTFDRVTLKQAGSVLGATTPALVRSFSRTFGIAPHRYVVARRVEAARKLLLEGAPVAQTAADVGFYDQAHFTRHFRLHVGITPAKFARSRRARSGADSCGGRGGS
jgi:AraC-like DNA-binding protein